MRHGLTEEMRFARFNETVGEMQGELQDPPESLRIGRRCRLYEKASQVPVESYNNPMTYDETAACWVVYEA